MGVLRTVFGVLACALLLTGGYALAATASVSLTAKGPEPATVSIEWGDTVAFSNVDTVERTVTSERAQMNSGAIPPGGTYEFQFTGRRGPNRFTQFGTRPNSFGFVVLTVTGKVTLQTSRQIVPYGSTITLAGRSSYPGTPVQVQFRPAGATGDWAPVFDVTAGANGTYSGRTRPTAGGRLRALVAAGQVSSELVDTRILPGLQIRVSRNRVKESRRIVVTGRVIPASAANSVDLEERSQGQSRWQRKATKAVSKRGTVTFVVKVSSGRNLLRLVLARGALNAGFAPVTSRPALVVGT
jgi:hypothetical protein